MTTDATTDSTTTSPIWSEMAQSTRPFTPTSPSSRRSSRGSSIEIGCISPTNLRSLVVATTARNGSAANKSSSCGTAMTRCTRSSTAVDIAVQLSATRSQGTPTSFGARITAGHTTTEASSSRSRIRADTKPSSTRTNSGWPRCPGSESIAAFSSDQCPPMAPISSSISVARRSTSICS